MTTQVTLSREHIEKSHELRSPNQIDPIAWSKRLHDWLNSREARPIQMNDSRDSIYEGCGE